MDKISWAQLFQNGFFSLLKKGSTLKVQELASKFFPFSVDPFSKGDCRAEKYEKKI